MSPGSEEKCFKQIKYVPNFKKIIMDNALFTLIIYGMIIGESISAQQVCHCNLLPINSRQHFFSFWGLVLESGRKGEYSSFTGIAGRKMQEKTDLQKSVILQLFAH